MPKKANVRMPRTITAAGIPGARRTVPRGTRRRNAHTAGGTPAVASATATPVGGPLSATSTAVTPATRTRAWPRRSASGVVPPATGGIARDRAGSVMTAASTTNGRSARNTARHPRVSAMALLAAGPMRPGMIHADANTANTRGRSAGGYARPTLA